MYEVKVVPTTVKGKGLNIPKIEIQKNTVDRLYFIEILEIGKL